MDLEEAQRQSQQVAKTLDAAITELSDKYDINIIISIMLGRSVGLAKMQRESGVMDRDDAIMWFGTALAEATQPLPPAPETEH